MAIQDINRIINMDIDDFLSLSQRDLSKQVAILGSAINKRVKRAKKSGRTSPALKQLEATGGNISAKGKTLNELRQEFRRAKNFLTSKTSTYKGMKEVEDAFQKRVGAKLNEEQKEQFWDIYTKLTEIDPYIKTLDISNKVQRELAELVESGGSVDDILNDMTVKVDAIYEQQKEEYADTDFYEI